ncbi:DNA-binding transcriptional regulator, LysR family [Paenibacillus algorifonticola]|uniref:DNA-binding transcriptional regulator, LysR family n=1 Tax=Paenibacillus algorifonticola TaxID=684063 RepID=A0A1I2H608_9BACL|nr:LysR family transcriptional regulator [Paenibacillus algorifonticola]SFF25112.1 DNA-binding transcriptional regulator, LysR family [Paenibacillus algorifonticola]
MDIRHLEYVLEVVRHESFTKAAEALHITQPTISKMIKNLEDELQTPLFIRSGKKVQLTDAGQAIVAQSQDIIRLFKTLQNELNDVTDFRKGLVRIGLPPMISSIMFPEIVSQFVKRYPGLTIRLVEEGSLKVEAEVASGAIDAGIVMLPVRNDQFEVFPIQNAALRVVMHHQHPLAGRSELTLRELEQEAFIMYREDFALHARIIDECARLGFKPKIMLESSQWDFISETVAVGLGIALLPEAICQKLDTARVSTIAMVDPVIPWNLAMIWRRDGYLSFAAQEWIRFTKAYFEPAE